MKVLTAAEFNRLCVNLWGDNFRPKAVEPLKRGLRTIERYSAGTANVPMDVRRRLAVLTAVKSEQMAEDAASYLE